MLQSTACSEYYTPACTEDPFILQNAEINIVYIVVKRLVFGFPKLNIQLALVFLAQSLRSFDNLGKKAKYNLTIKEIYNFTQKKL